MTALIRLGDVVFVTGWLGVISLLVMLDLALASRILSGAHPDRLLVAAAKIFWPTAAIWLVFTAWMLTHCVRTHRLNREERRTWIATMLLNIVIVGPTAYYVASYRT